MDRCIVQKINKKRASEALKTALKIAEQENKKTRPSLAALHGGSDATKHN